MTCSVLQPKHQIDFRGIKTYTFQDDVYLFSGMSERANSEVDQVDKPSAALQFDESLIIEVDSILTHEVIVLFLKQQIYIKHA